MKIERLTLNNNSCIAGVFLVHCEAGFPVQKERNVLHLEKIRMIMVAVMRGNVTGILVSEYSTG